jgi:hypothetical protein
MADLWSIISSNYVAVGLNASRGPNTPYVPVDPATYQGTWTGAYANNTKFSLQISNVNGFRAKVRYQSGATLQYQDVLIKDGSFKFGNTKFTLDPNKPGSAQIKNVVVDPASGTQYLDTAYATQNT